jgi:hypothetical protein
MEQSGNNIQINGRLDKIEQTLERLESALLGDKYNGHGYIKKIDSLSDRVEKLEKAQQAQLWFFLGAGGLGGAGLVKLIEHFLQ